MKRYWIWILAAAVLLAIIVDVAMNRVNKDEQLPPPDLTPSVSREQLEQEVDFVQAEKDGSIAVVESGEVLISSGHTANEAAQIPLRHNAPAPLLTTAPDALWELTFDDAFTLPDAVLLPNGSLGKLNIPTIGLEVAIYETDDEIEDMSVGVAHMKETSCWNGNVGLAGHNRGVNNNFGKLYTLKTGDSITLTTALGSREYGVTDSSVIDENDWSVLGRREQNCLTLITCIDNQPTKRLCVLAVQK